MRIRSTILLLTFAAALSAAAQAPPAALVRHLEAARRAQAKQDCRTAAEEYGLAIRLMPASGELYSNQGSALYCDEQIPEAVKAFTKALALQPRLFAPHLFLGLAAFHAADMPSAVHHLSQAVLLNPSDVTAHLWLGYAEVAQSDYEAALKQFVFVTQQDMQSLSTQQLDAEYAAGQCYLEIGRRRARDLATLAPNSRLLLQLASEQYRLTGNAAKAAQVAAQGAQQASQSSRSSSNSSKAQRLYDQALDAEAKAQQAFQQVVRLAPDSYRTHQILGDAAVAMQQAELAISEYRKVLEQNPALPGIHESISNCLMQTGQFSQALEELQQEQKLQPYSARVQMETGRVELAMGLDAGAIATLEHALSLSTPPAETYLLLGKAKLRADDAHAAIPLLQKYVAQEPNAPVAYYLLGRAYRITGNQVDMAHALEAYKRTSQDEHDRQVLQQVTRDPAAVPTVMNAEEVKDANALVSAHP